MKKKKQNTTPADELLFLRRRVAELEGAEEKRRESERMLKDSEKRYRQLFEHMSSGLAVYEAVDGGKDFVFRDFNRAAEKIDKLKRKDVVGKRVGELFPSIDSFGLLEVFRHVWKTGDPQRHPVSVYEDNRIIGWRDNYVYRLSGGEIVAVYDDVTREKQAEEALAEREAYLKSFFSAVPTGIGLVVERVLVDVNRKFCRMLGYTKKELLGKSSRMLYPTEEDFAYVGEEKYRQISKNGVGTVETHLLCKDGRILDVVLSSAPVDQDDYSKGITFTVLDISARKAAENQLKESRERLQILFANIRDAVFVHPVLENGASGAFERVNSAACEMLGYRERDLLKMKPRELIDPEFYSRDLPAIRTVIKQQGQVLFEAVLVHRTGRKIPVEISAKNVWIGDDPYTISTARDIRERKKAEDELRKISTAVTQSPGIVVITDSEGRIEYVNPKFTELTGYTMQEVAGKNPRFLQSGKMSREFYEDLWKTILSGREWRGEFLNRKKNGDLYWEDAIISPVRNEQSQITHFVAVREDVTEKKTLWRALIEAKEKAEESDRLKSRFLANISHEIRTPMNGILGFSELLKEPQLSGEEKEKYIDLINDSGRRMLSIINDLIDISKIEAGEMRILRNETNVNELMKSIRDFFSPQAATAGLSLICRSLLPAEDCVIITDRTRLNQVLSNLVQNSIKYTRKGNIEFGCRKTDGMLEFHVRDTGIGIPHDMKDKVFEYFRQGSLEATHEYDGAGLGLSLCKAFIEMLGGTIWVDSEQGKGSVFYFTLPFERPKPETLSSVASGTGSTVTLEPGIRILVVEDDSTNRLLLQTVLGKHHATVLVAENGREAVEKVKEEPRIDIVLMDMKMPVMNGYEAAKKIKEMRPSLPILAQTAFASDVERGAALGSGCDAVVSKPIDLDELLQTIRAFTAEAGS